MAANAHSTPVPAVSISDASHLNRRTALMALPAISGVAALEAAAARAAPPTGMDAAIARLEAAQAALKACEALCQRLSDGIDDIVSVSMGKNNRGQEVRAYSESEIHRHLDAGVEFWGPDSNAKKYLDTKIAEFREVRDARLKVERDSGLTACLDRLESLGTEHDAAVEALLAIKPASLGEARRKIATLAEPLATLLAEIDIDDAKSLLLALA
ncbi:MAG: hypothetical protein NVV72_14645 [Asticcacaulis sp.]|nr:hypothetical protein [Asticcacaulis sp.]